MEQLTKNRIKYIQSLKDKKSRDQHKTFVAEGDKMVSELLALMDCQLLLATTEFLTDRDLHASNIEQLIKVSKNEIEKVSLQKNPQQALAVFYQPRFVIDTKNISTQLSLALDGIQDPGNLGTIIRLADWYGIENIYCSKDTVDAFNPKVVQATMGALARVKVHYIDLVDFLKTLSDCPVYGTFLDGTNMYEKTLSASGIIVMGNEGNGIRADVEKMITDKLFIPNYPPDRNTSESLNVAVATAIICSEFRKRLF